MIQGLLWVFITLYAWLTTSLRQLGENSAQHRRWWECMTTKKVLDAGGGGEKGCRERVSRTVYLYM